MFDLDQTLITPRDGRPFPRDAADWQWLRPSVPEQLRALVEQDGFDLILVTNQTKAWKRELVQGVLEALAPLPVSVVVAFDRADHKPSTRLFRSHFPEAIPAGSFFVGDAAGRPGDHSDSDRVFAEALGLPFRVPEDVFPLPFADVAPLDVPVSDTPELILLIGYPGSGKSTWAQRWAAQQGWLHLEMDVFGTPARVRAKALSPDMRNRTWILDATHPTVEKRSEWITWARSLGRSTRAVWLEVPIDIAMQRNAERARQGGRSVPRVAFYTYRKRFEEPTTTEGFLAVHRIAP